MYKTTFRLGAFVIVCIMLMTGCAGNSSNSSNSAGTENGTANETPNETPNAPNDKLPIATIEMENGGTIKLELYPEVAPNTVANFISLAKKGFYDGVIFHRVIEGFMIQGGDPEGTGKGGPGYMIKGEFTNNGFKNDLKHVRGVISMARQGGNRTNTAGSQFFIMEQDVAQLDGDYAAFGQVIQGMETVDKIVAVQTDRDDKPLENQTIKKITIDTKGIDYPEPEKVTK